LLERYTPTSRMVQNIKKEIQAVEESIVGPLEDARRIELSKLENELNALKAKADGLRRQIGQISGEVRAIDSREKEFLNLKREFSTHEGNYKNYLAKYEESRIVDDMNTRKLSNVSIVQNAIVPIRPAPDKKRQLIPLSIIVGLVAGFGLAYFRELVPQRLTTPLAAEKHLGLPVMVSIALKK
ncbi:MAG: GNVR domain-containing protein, partial [Syntrophorhabdus sp.]